MYIVVFIKGTQYFFKNNMWGGGGRGEERRGEERRGEERRGEERRGDGMGGGGKAGGRVKLQPQYFFENNMSRSNGSTSN